MPRILEIKTNKNFATGNNDLWVRLDLDLKKGEDLNSVTLLTPQEIKKIQQEARQEALEEGKTNEVTATCVFNGMGIVATKSGKAYQVNIDGDGNPIIQLLTVIK